MCLVWYISVQTHILSATPPQNGTGAKGALPQSCAHCATANERAARCARPMPIHMHVCIYAVRRSGIVIHRADVGILSAPFGSDTRCVRS